MEQKEYNIELNNEEIQSFLGKTPPWILRSGLSIMLFIVIFFTIGAALFKYPDTITATATLTGTTPPARIKAKVTGILNYIYIKDNQYVKEGDYLAVIENPANTEDIVYLKSYLRNFFIYLDTVSELPKKELKLGGLQENYSIFHQKLSEYMIYKKSNYSESKLSVVNKRFEYLFSYIRVLERQKEIIAKQNKLNFNIFQRDSILHLEKLLSPEEYEKAQKEYLNGFLTLENINSAIQSSKVQIAEIEENFMDSENSFMEKENNYTINIKNLTMQLLASIRDWEMNYVLTAPICGKLSYNNYWAEKQNIIAGEEIFYIVPNDNGRLIAKAFLPVTRSGKIKVNQKVNLHLENYPDNEYGIVKGKIANISKVPSINQNGAYYTAEIGLPDGLLTSYKKTLPYYPDMNGQVDIITEDMSLLERVFLPIKKILTEGFSN